MWLAKDHPQALDHSAGNERGMGCDGRHVNHLINITMIHCCGHCYA